MALCSVFRMSKLAVPPDERLRPASADVAPMTTLLRNSLVRSSGSMPAKSAFSTRGRTASARAWDSSDSSRAKSSAWRAGPVAGRVVMRPFVTTALVPRGRSRTVSQKVWCSWSRVVDWDTDSGSVSWRRRSSSRRPASAARLRIESVLWLVDGSVVLWIDSKRALLVKRRCKKGTIFWRRLLTCAKGEMV
jgi:hypothetical protein